MKENTISDISKSYGIPASTLRYYEELGIIKNVERNSSGKRVYTKEHIDRLNAILCFKNAGMTMSDIISFFRFEENEYDSIKDMMHLLTDRKSEVEKNFAELFHAYEHLLRKIDYYSAIEHYVTSASDDKQKPAWSDYSTIDYKEKAYETITEIIVGAKQ